jgi:hypothetical protein
MDFLFGFGACRLWLRIFFITTCVHLPFLITLEKEERNGQSAGVNSKEGEKQIICFGCQNPEKD